MILNFEEDCIITNKQTAIENKQHRFLIDKYFALKHEDRFNNTDEAIIIRRDLINYENYLKAKYIKNVQPP